MARGRKTGGSNFQPGNKLGRGAIPLPPELKDLKRMPKDYFSRIAYNFLSMPFMEFEIYLTEIKNKTVGESFIAAIIAEGMKNKNHLVMEWIAQRCIGRVEGMSKEDEQEHSNNINRQLVTFFKERQQKKLSEE